MPIIQINNKDVHVIEMNEGASETIVMMHGMFTNLSVFYFNIAPELAKHYHIVMYDLRSHGLSQRIEEGYTLEIMSNDLLSLMDALSLNKVHMVGYSFGGLIALYTALNYPDRVNKLAIIESPDPSHKETHELLAKYGEEFMKQHFINYTKSTNIAPGRRQIEKNQKLYEYLFNNGSLKSDLIADKDFLIQAPLDQLSHSTLLLYGSDSDCLNTGKHLHSRIPDSKFMAGEGNHNIPVQNPEWINKMLKDFFVNNNG